MEHGLGKHAPRFLPERDAAAFSTAYQVSSTLTLYLNKEAGLVLRCKGHRQYYDASLTSDQVSILAMVHGVRSTLNSAPFHAETNHPYSVTFQCKGSQRTLQIDGATILEATDDRYIRSGCGLFVDQGTILVDGFHVCAGNAEEE